eukprot:1784454-Prymnesium_polylepis.1
MERNGSLRRAAHEPLGLRLLDAGLARPRIRATHAAGTRHTPLARVSKRPPLDQSNQTWINSPPGD